ncbi:MAG: ArsR/SmtB family transcription factor [Bacillota bacterium]
MEEQKKIYELQAEFCKFMANAKRIEILCLLGNREMCVDELATAMGVNVPNISQHLGVMREKGVVESRREGTKIYYRLASSKTLQACVLVREAMVEQMAKQYHVVRSSAQQSPDMGEADA